MILCCKTCGNIYISNSSTDCCNYCGNEGDIIISNKEFFSISSSDFPRIVNIFREKYKTVDNPNYNSSLWSIRAQKEATEENSLQTIERTAKLMAISSMKTTTGYNFEGYSITQYLDIVNAECIIGTGFLSELSAGIDDIFGTASNAFENKLDKARQQAITKLKTKTIHIGGNAIIGVDFDYITFTNNMIGVIASGTAITVEAL